MRRVIFYTIMMLAALGCQNVDNRVEPTLNVAADKFAVSYKAQDIEIVVDSNTNIEVDIDVDWVELVEIRNEESKVVVLRISMNETERVRWAVVAIMAGDLRSVVAIEQEMCPNMMDLVVGHSGTTLESPTWRGANVDGSVDWGDGTAEESYSEGMSHDYTDNGPHTATFNMIGAESFKIEQIGEIDDIRIVLR